MQHLLAGGERAHERGLADARLAADEHEAAALRPEGVEAVEQIVALEQLGHAWILLCVTARFNPRPESV